MRIKAKCYLILKQASDRNNFRIKNNETNYYIDLTCSLSFRLMHGFILSFVKTSMIGIMILSFDFPALLVSTRSNKPGGWLILHNRDSPTPAFLGWSTRRLKSTGNRHRALAFVPTAFSIEGRRKLLLIL